MWEYIWGVKTIATFDVWTIEHLLSGLSIGSAVVHHNKKHFHNFFYSVQKFFKKQNMTDKIKTWWREHSNHATVTRFDLIAVLFLAYIWETLEHYLETGLAGNLVEFWFQGVEVWSNRLISDPLMLVLGYYIAKKFPVLVWPARVLSVIWLFVHIFIFPHSMYLHYLF